MKDGQKNRRQYSPNFQFDFREPDGPGHRLCFANPADVERYPTVLQLTSTVTADLNPGASLFDLLTALFPCGSVTGAPKISTTRKIAELEASPRGVYCGALGWLGPDGEAVFNVAIRTITVDMESGIAEYGTGGGITWDSRAGDEYREAIAKTAILKWATVSWELLETIRLEAGRYHLLERHLQRLLESAEYFSILVEIARVREALADHVRLWPEAARRVRLLVAQTGAPGAAGCRGDPRNRSDGGRRAPGRRHVVDQQPARMGFGQAVREVRG